MPKRTPAFDPAQMDMGFEPAPQPAGGSLSNLEQVTASAVALILKEDVRSRHGVAAGVSELLDESVTKWMLDAYASEARDGHNISFARMLALIADTGRYDVLRGVLRRIGADLVVGEEVLTVELGQIEAQLQRLQERKRQLKGVAPVIAKRRGS